MTIFLLRSVVRAGQVERVEEATFRGTIKQAISRASSRFGQGPTDTVLSVHELNSERTLATRRIGDKRWSYAQ